MVFDAVRNAAYADAIRRLVTPASTVLDLGAGLGIHGLIAAHAGARKVYLLEPEAILDAAMEVAERNRLGRRVIAIGTRLRDAVLPEPVDLIVSVFTGNCLLEEDLLPVLFEARDRYLAPGGKLVPDRAVMEVVPVCAPAFHAEEIAIWCGNAQGIAFDAVRGYAANSVYTCRGSDLRADFLAAPAGMLDLDFMTATEAACRGRVSFRIARDGLCHGLLGWFGMRLADAWLSTSPQASATHWGRTFFPVDPPIALNEGDEVAFDLKRPEHGDWTWTVASGSARQRHSTFLSLPLSPRIMRKKADSYQPQIGRAGSACQYALARMDGNATVAQIARELAERFPDLYPRAELAGRFVRELASRFG